ncbi:hypothetical protein FIU91_00280 [Roseivivax sp. THAF30]|nr:hypothetical protein FIU91_00280 [Roseivivax sp. THAF30]
MEQSGLTASFDLVPLEVFSLSLDLPLPEPALPPAPALLCLPHEPLKRREGSLIFAGIHTARSS